MDIFVVLENILYIEFIIEDMKMLIGFVWICMMLVYMMLLDVMRLLDVMLEFNMGLLGGIIFYWCMDIDFGEVYFLFKKLCMKFVVLVFWVVVKILWYGLSLFRKKVMFLDREEIFFFVVNLIFIVVCL